MHAFLRLHPDGTCLAVKVQPRAPKNEIGETMGSELKIKITAPPVDDAANEALLRFLADQLDCPRSAVQLVQGHKSHHKVVFVRGMDASTIEQRLSAPT
ncbi:MAG: DUF167 domain-containing protein [Verrucomicrobia bacterium]|nr:DUF167 domain-containing protein [Verrucomicrobiota bacterium]